jgi:hypothetical protein
VYTFGSILYVKNRIKSLYEPVRCPNTILINY